MYFKRVYMIQTSYTFVRPPVQTKSHQQHVEQYERCTDQGAGYYEHARHIIRVVLGTRLYWWDDVYEAWNRTYNINALKTFHALSFTASDSIGTDFERFNSIEYFICSYCKQTQLIILIIY